MRFLDRRLLAVAALALAAAALPGCLVCESEEELFSLNPGEESGSYTLVVRNIQSDQKGSRQQQEDFDKLLELWRGDRYLLDRVRGGVYVRNRHVSLEEETLVGRENGLFCDLANIGLNRGDDGIVRRGVESSMKVVSTNGNVLEQGDSTVVWWPAKTVEFKLKSRAVGFHSGGDLVGRFRAWTR